MNNFVKNISTTLSIALMMFLTSFQVMADDTEIFFSSVSLSGSTSIQPNVLMVLDTSSSMNTEVGSTGMNRLEHMKEAMHSILDNANNINVGIMRFHGKGGPVLFPVADINADVDTVLGSTSTGIPQTFNRIENGTDDVEEIDVAIFPNFVYTDGELTMGNETLGGGACGDSGNTNISIRINDGDDDVEEDDDGDVDDGSSDLELVDDGDDQHVGLRFNSVNIPTGSSIVCAYIDFEVDEKHTTDTDLDIYVQNIGDAPAFIDGNDTYDVTGRISSGDANVSWDNADAANKNAILTSPDISSLVQNVVDRGDWVSGNSMAFIINGSGKREVESYNGESSAAPLLRVEYAAAGAGYSGAQRVGLRFSDVKIPQGSTITAAYIDFTSTNESQSSASVINIHAEDTDDSSAFSQGLTNDLTNRIGTDTSSSPLAWSVPAWSANTLYSTPDIKDLVQDIVDRTNWCGGNAMSFVFDAQSGLRKAVSDDGDQGVSPALRIEFDESSATGCNTLAIQAQIKTGNDDAEEETSSGDIDFGSSDIELNEDGSTSQIVGLRFQDINVSSSDTIVSAELEFTVDDDDTDSDTINVTIYGEYEGDSQAFSSTNKISTRTKTTASVNWSPDPWSSAGDKHVTPDISSLVQEIVGHSGWSALNNMSFIIEGTTGERTAESYNDNPINAAKLRINITGSGTGSSAGTITVRQQLKNVVDEIAYKSGTPIVDTLYEAGAYYRGDEVLFGRTRGGGAALSPITEDIGSRSEYTRVSHEASYIGATPTRDGSCNADNLSHSDCESERIEGAANYISPIKYECQDNHIIFLSDGSPSRWNLDEVPGTPYFGATSSCAGSGDGKCGEEILAFLQDNDQIDDSTLSDDQKVTTHTIGFNFAGSTYLQDLASAGGGGFYEASTASQLTTVFTQIFADVLQAPTSFVAPAVSINTFNRLTHRDELYFALFEPDDKPRWSGNMKRYRLDTSGASPIVVDVLDNPAVSSVTGFFTSSAKSWWSDVTDGEDIREGGFAGEIGTSRNLYTYTGSNSALTHSSNSLINSNASLTDGMLNIVTEQAADSNYRANLLSWLGGTDVQDEDEDNSTTDARKYIGDPLHSRPAIITYGYRGFTTVPDSIAYFGTNEGFIHAVDTHDGSEVFSFMPAELLPNAKLLYANQGTPADHYYGVDGTITSWVKDVNHNSILTDTGDHVYIYAGMRRGGSNYYALDVTNRTAPILLWTINGGSGDFAELGQTWSQPVKSKVKIGNTLKDVLIFSGGYDENQDNATTPQNDNSGRALYIVDASTGARLWWAGPAGSGADLEVTNLNNSMPAKPSVIDLGADGTADHVYIGDTGGKVWRFDFTQGNAANTFGSATMLANLGDTDGSLGANATNDLENNRRFYHTPSVSFKAPLSSQTLYVAIGSGFHAHPLNQDVHDRFYVLEDSDVLGGSPMTLPLTEASLYDSTDNAIQDGTDQATIDAAKAQRSSKPGWYLRLEESSTSQIGEKALSKASIFSGILFLTTYLPENPSSTSVAAACSAAAGVGRVYAMDLRDGSSVFGFNSTVAGLDKNDRFVQLNHVGIPPEVQIIIPGGGSTGGSGGSKIPVLLVGTETINDKVNECTSELCKKFFKNPTTDIIHWSN